MLGHAKFDRVHLAVSAVMSIGAELDSVLWIGIGLLAAGGLLAI